MRSRRSIMRGPIEVRSKFRNMDVFRSHPGCIEVITGSMFSGKSEELIRRLRLRRAQIARQRVQIFEAHLIDERYSQEHIVSAVHYQNSRHLYALRKPREPDAAARRVERSRGGRGCRRLRSALPAVLRARSEDDQSAQQESRSAERGRLDSHGAVRTSSGSRRRLIELYRPRGHRLALGASLTWDWSVAR